MRLLIHRSFAILGVAVVVAVPALAQEAEGKRQRAKVGKPAPGFKLRDCNGKQRKLSDYAGKIIVLEWINKGCPFSVKAGPTMIETAKKYRDKDVVWLAIDSTYFNKEADNVEYIEEKGIPYPILMDTDGEVAKTYAAKCTPHMFVIGTKGILAYSGAIDNRRTKDGYRNYVVEALDLLLAGKPVEVSRTRPYGCTIKLKE